MARTGAERPVLPNDEHAVSWCLLGGLRKIAVPNGYDQFSEDERERRFLRHAWLRASISNSITTLFGPRYKTISAFNDAASHKDVLRVIDHAIAAAEQRLGG